MDTRPFATFAADTQGPTFASASGTMQVTGSSGRAAVIEPDPAHPWAPPRLCAVEWGQQTVAWCRTTVIEPSEAPVAPVINVTPVHEPAPVREPASASCCQSAPRYLVGRPLRRYPRWSPTNA